MSVCNTCGYSIDWDPKVRESLNWKGPLNPDKTIHKCYTKVKETQQKTIQNPQIAIGSQTNEERIIALQSRIAALEKWAKSFSL